VIFQISLSLFVPKVDFS